MKKKRMDFEVGDTVEIINIEDEGHLQFNNATGIISNITFGNWHEVYLDKIINGCDRFLTTPDKLNPTGLKYYIRKAIK